MPQCKKSGCREQVVYNNRWGHMHYCSKHGHAYADKRAAQQRARARMPDCESGISPSCAGKVSALAVSRGEVVCYHCADAIEQLAALDRVQARARELEERKMREFDDATTIEDLKKWIEEYLL